MNSVSFKKRLVSALHPRFSNLLDRANRVPRYTDYVSTHGQPAICSDRDALYALCAEEIRDCPIDYLEFGVFRGDSLRWWSEHNTNPQSLFYGFDSFEGLPEAWLTYDAGHFSTGGRIPLLNDPRVTLVKGLFQDTLDEFLGAFEPRGRLVVNSDSDLYSSTLYTLAKIDHLLKPGSIVFFDEFDDVQHEFRALEDYCAAFRKDFKIVAGTPRLRTAMLEAA